jgi:hypothetical protein
MTAEPTRRAGEDGIARCEAGRFFSRVLKHCSHAPDGNVWHTILSRKTVSGGAGILACPNSSTGC